MRATSPEFLFRLFTVSSSVSFGASRVYGPSYSRGSFLWGASSDSTYDRRHPAAATPVIQAGQISLGKSYAGNILLVERREDGSIVLTAVAMVPDSVRRLAVVAGGRRLDAAPALLGPPRSRVPGGRVAAHCDVKPSFAIAAGRGREGRISLPWPRRQRR